MNSINKKGQLSVGTLILLAVGIIFATVIIQQIIANQSTATTKLLAYNETDVNPSCWQNYQAGGSWLVNTSRSSCNITVDRKTNLEWQTENCPITAVVVRNNTNQTAVSGTDYVVFDTIGVIALQNTTFWHNNSINNTGNRTFNDYNFCGIGYNTDGGARSIASLWSLFAVLALLGFVLTGIDKDWFNF